MVLSRSWADLLHIEPFSKFQLPFSSLIFLSPDLLMIPEKIHKSMFTQSWKDHSKSPLPLSGTSGVTFSPLSCYIPNTQRSQRGVRPKRGHLVDDERTFLPQFFRGSWRSKLLARCQVARLEPPHILLRSLCEGGQKEMVLVWWEPVHAVTHTTLLSIHAVLDRFKDPAAREFCV